MIKVGTICSGIGAPEKALRNLGIEYDLAYFCEIDKFAAKSYCAIHNVDPDKNLGDLTKVDIATLPHDLDLLVGGTPCQDFSNAGLRQGGEIGSGTRSSLMWNFVEIIRETQPKGVLWENVPGCFFTKMRTNYEKFINALYGAGYKVHAQILNASIFGVPQDRLRVFVLAIRKDIATDFEMPTGYDCGIRLKDMLETDVDEKYFLTAEQIESLLNKKFTQRDYKHTVQPKNGHCRALQASDSKAPCCIELTQGQIQGYRIYSADGLSVALTADGGGLGGKTGLYIIPHGYLKGGFKAVDYCPSITTSSFQENNFVIDLYNGSIRNNGIAGTLTTGTAHGSSGTFGVLIKVGQDGTCEYFYVRKLTPKECFRLMGFADSNFMACKAVKISDTQLYKQAGNSIVVNVLMAIFGKLYDVAWEEKVYGDFYKPDLSDLPICVCVDELMLMYGNDKAVSNA